VSIKLLIEIEGPLGPDDKDILTGATMILLSLAQQYAAPDEPADPLPCHDLEMTMADDSRILEATGRVCVSDVGHQGRHKYRMPAEVMRATMEGLN